MMRRWRARREAREAAEQAAHVRSVLAAAADPTLDMPTHGEVLARISGWMDDDAARRDHAARLDPSIVHEGSMWAAYR